MNNSVREYLISYALAIQNFRCLSISEQQWLFPLLSKGVRTTLEILCLIEKEPMTFEAIASTLGINQETARQKLNALALGGMNLQITETKAFAPTGRPRKLVSKQQ